MKKLNLIIAAIIFAFVLIACNDTDMASNSAANDENPTLQKTPPPVIPAIPVISYIKKEIIRRAEVTNVYVMNEDGTNITKLFSLSATTLAQWAYPRWAANGTRTLYYGNDGDLYTWNGNTYRSRAVWLTDISVVNNVPIATNTRKIWDGAANSMTSYDRAWNPAPNSNEIAIIALYTPTTEWSIVLIPTNGAGIPNTIYTETGGYFFQQLTFSPDGQYIALARSNSSTNTRSIRIISASTGEVLNDYDLSSQFTSISKLETPRSTSSNTIVFHGGTQDGLNNMYILDLATGTTSLAIPNGTRTWGGCYSPDDSKMVHVCSTTPVGIRIYDFLNGITTNVLDANGQFTSWKR